MNKHTPRPSDVMAYFDLSDEQWDILPDSVVDRLTEIYMKETAAPAMYEALVETMRVLRSLRDNKEEWYTLVTPELLTAWDKNKAALAQAEGRQ